jgi:hypothetical protein
MIAKTLSRRTVEFFATSPRIVRAYRSAARHSASLTRFATMHDLGHVSAAHRIVNHAGEIELVVLSHVDEDHLVLTNERVEPIVSEAFHVLFTEPTTHPDQIARWMRTTNIRSEDRLHVVRVDDLEAPQVSQLLGRVCFALGRGSARGGIIDAYLAGDSLLVRGPKHRMLHVPLSSIRALTGQPRSVIQNFEIDPDGSFLCWPDLDVRVRWDQFLQAVDPEELRKAQQRTEGYNERYGAAIRKLREQAGLSQSQIEGLTERQVRRIEQGECRATNSALAALAKAHGLDTNSYMEQVAKAMK